MAFNGSGTFNLYTPGNPVVTGTTISSTWANNTLTDIASGLSTCITKDGQTTTTAAIPFASGIQTDTITEKTAGSGVTISKQLNTSAATVASAATANIGGAAGNYITITGNTPITGFGTVAAGAMRAITFNAATNLVYNASTNILPTAGNITTQAGDAALMASEGSGIWRMLSYQRANGGPVQLGMAAKAWVQYDSTGAISTSFNVASVTDSSAGVLIPVWATDFASTNYVVVGMPRHDGLNTTATTFVVMANDTNFLAGSCVILTRRISDAALTDVTYMMVVAFGDQ